MPGDVTVRTNVLFPLAKQKNICYTESYAIKESEEHMAGEKKPNYGNESISALKGADRVRKRPGVIFGSDGLEGCEHAVFEILSNSIFSSVCPDSASE